MAADVWPAFLLASIALTVCNNRLTSRLRATGCNSVKPTMSYRVQIFGCFSEATARASRSKRARRSSRLAMCSGRTLTATVRSSRVSRQASGAAVSTLLKIMVDSSVLASSRVRAAENVLEKGARAIEMEEMEARLARLEKWQQDADRRDA